MLVYLLIGTLSTDHSKQR